MMNDYCARESTLNETSEVAREQSIKMSIQETHKILREMNCLLQEFSSVVNGSRQEDKTEKDASCLWDEARLLTALAYENLHKLSEIKGSII